MCFFSPLCMEVWLCIHSISTLQPGLGDMTVRIVYTCINTSSISKAGATSLVSLSSLFHLVCGPPEEGPCINSSFCLVRQWFVLVWSLQTGHSALLWLRLSVAYKACLPSPFGVVLFFEKAVHYHKHFKRIFKHTNRFFLHNPLHKSGTQLWFISGLTHISPLSF